MISNETELKDDVRELTGYTSTNVLTSDGLDTAYRTAQRHIRITKSLPSDFGWFDSEKVEARDALFWFTCLFTKVQVGELDSQDLQMGAVEQKTLLAKANNEETTWYRNAEKALRSIKSGSIFASASPAREDRTYEADSYQRDSSGTDAGSTDL